MLFKFVVYLHIFKHMLFLQVFQYNSQISDSVKDNNQIGGN